MTTPTSLTLIGYLGKDRETRQTRERTYTKTVHNPVIDGDEEIEIRVPSRTYLKLSLATHERTASGPLTRWHDLIFWRPERQILMARKGDHIQVTGRFEEYQMETAEGDTVCRRHFVVETFRFLRMKIRAEAA